MTHYLKKLISKHQIDSQIKSNGISMETYNKLREYNKPPLDVEIEEGTIWFVIKHPNGKNFHITYDFISKSRLSPKRKNEVKELLKKQ